MTDKNNKLNEVLATFTGSVEELTDAMEAVGISQTKDGIETEINGFLNLGTRCFMEVGRRFAYVKKHPEIYGFAYNMVTSIKGHQGNSGKTVKELTGKCTWMEWAVNTFGLSAETISTYIRAYTLFKESKYADIVGLSNTKYLSSIINTLNVNTEHIDAFLTTKYTSPHARNRKQIKDMTVRELKAIAKELNKAKKEGEDITTYEKQENILKSSGYVTVPTSTNAESLDKEIHALKVAKHKAEQETQKQAGEIERLKAELSNVRKERNNEAHKNNESKKRNQTYLNEIAELKRQLANAQAQPADTTELERLKDELLRVQTDLKQQRNNNDWLVSQMNDVKAAQTQLKAEKEALESEKETWAANLEIERENMRKEIEILTAQHEETKEEWQKRYNENKVTVFKSLLNELDAIKDKYYFIVADAPLFLDFLNGCEEYADKMVAYENWWDVVDTKWRAHRGEHVEGDTVEADFVEID